MAEAPPQHRGAGFVAKTQLTSAGIYEGELNGRGELQGDGQKVKGGWDTRYGFAPGGDKWLVCRYGDRSGITWWERIDAKVTACTLHIRGDQRAPADARATCG